MAIRYWWQDRDYVHAVASHAVEEGELRGVDDVLYFFEKPWKFQELEVAYDSWCAAAGEAQDEFNAREP